MNNLESEQKERIKKFGDFIITKTVDVFDLQELIDSKQAFYISESDYSSGVQTLKHQDKIDELISEIEKSFDADFIAKTIPDFYFNPTQTNLSIKNAMCNGVADTYVYLIFAVVAHQWIIRNPSTYAVTCAADRIKYIAHDFLKKGERGMSYREYSSLDALYFEPLPYACAELIAKMYEQDGALDYINHILNGDWCEDLSKNDDVYEINSCQASGLDYAVPELLQSLENLNNFSYDAYKNIAAIYPNMIHADTIGYEEDHEDGSEVITEFDQKQIDFKDRLIWEITEEFDHEKYGNIYDSIDRASTFGGKWVLRALDYIEKYDIKSLSDNLYYSDNQIKSIAAMMAKSTGLSPNESEVGFIEALKKYKAASLLLILPICDKVQKYVIEAMEWEAAKPLLDYIKRTAEKHGDFYNSENEQHGVIDKQEVEVLIDEAGEKIAKKLLSQMRKAKIDCDRTTYLFEAIKGWNEKNIRSSLKKDTQIAIKAYGLLPINDNNTEQLDRYLEFREIEKNAKKYGAERQANTRAAARVGISNLGKSAGFHDPIRFEWKMESQLSSEVIPKGRKNIEQWEIELSMGGAEPSINIYKQDKLLKSVPPAVRKTDTYKELMEWKKQLKAQTTRFKRTLENMMVSREPLSLSDLKTLVKLPVVSNLLSKLILKDSKGHYGTFQADNLSLKGIDNRSIPIDKEVVIAHSFDLFHDDNLSLWQRYIINNHIVQPFKQTHRELYILTPAEENTETFSNRFAGHVVDGAKASRLFQSRNWQMVSSDSAEVYKYFPNEKILAEIEFPDAGHYLSENEIITTDQIYFVHKRERMKLIDVPPVIFSEIMRDCDLVVSVALADEDDMPMTKESLITRANLISMLLENISLKNISIEEHFAHIKGKLANYRIHLGSGVIHIVPGNYLCIVPNNAVKVNKDLYLPFADKEPKTSEIISKVIMLSNDSKIKDESILAQIKNGGLL